MSESEAADDTLNKEAGEADAPTDASQPLAGAWQKLLTTWDDDDAHRRFIALCAALGDLAYAGGQYRHVVELNDERHAAAKRYVDAVVAAAVVQLSTHTPPTRDHKRTLTIVAFVLSVGISIYAVRLILLGM